MMNTATLIDQMPTVAEHATGTWARNFATSMCRQSLRPGWKPSPKQARMMRLIVKQIPDDCDGFDVIDHNDHFNQEEYHDTYAQDEHTHEGHIDRAGV